jgi:hypothetical protein
MIREGTRTPEHTAAGAVMRLFVCYNFGFDFLDDFATDPFYFGEIVNGLEFTMLRPVSDNGFSLGLAYPVECCQLVHGGGVDVDLGKGCCREKENEHDGHVQFFHSPSFC